MAFFKISIEIFYMLKKTFLNKHNKKKHERMNDNYLNGNGNHTTKTSFSLFYVLAQQKEGH